MATTSKNNETKVIDWTRIDVNVSTSKLDKIVLVASTDNGKYELRFAEENAKWLSSILKRAVKVAEKGS